MFFAGKPRKADAQAAVAGACSKQQRTIPMDTIHAAAGNAQEEIRELREQVETLMRERVTPALSQAAHRAQQAARQVGDMAQDQTEAVSEKVREWPLTSLLIAAGVGYMFGRFTR
jgi:ElaB/YqjD/DUF883 family membrane-anchored ribosome-binding protein